METRAHYVLVGAFVVAVLLAAFVAVVWLAGAQFQREGTIYDIYFRGSVSGLSDGAAVRYKGVSIGRVLNIRLDPENVERIRVRVEIDSATPIKEDAVAELEAQGITGLAFVQINGGSNASPDLKKRDDKRYPIIASKPSRLEEVVMSAPELLKRATLVADRLVLVLSDENLASIAQTLGHVSTFTGAIAGDAAQIDKIVADAGATMTELRAAAAAAQSLTTEFGQALNAHDGIADRSARAIQELNQSAKNLTQLTAHLDSVIQENRGALRELTQTGFGQAQQLLTDSRALVVELTRVADQLERDPARFLFGDRREGYRPR
jgi:phospholipid/cholesterol/gamma-HCH transport system substrate-binding protein